MRAGVMVVIALCGTAVFPAGSPVFLLPLPSTMARKSFVVSNQEGTQQEGTARGEARGERQHGINTKSGARIKESTPDRSAAVPVMVVRSSSNQQ